MYERYGGPEMLELRNLPTPVAGPGEVLVEVVATSINLSDWENLHGSPAYARIGGLRRPRQQVLGSDIAGRVVVAPGELQVGVLLGVLGAPAFVLLVRYGDLAEL